MLIRSIAGSRRLMARVTTVTGLAACLTLAASGTAQSAAAQSGTAPSAAREFPTPNRPISRIVAMSCPSLRAHASRDQLGSVVSGRTVQLATQRHSDATR